VRNTNKGGIFSTIYSAVWLEGPRWIWDEDAEQWTRNGPIKVALKKFNSSQNMSEDYLKQVSFDFNYLSLLLLKISIKFIIILFNQFNKVIKWWKCYGLSWND